MLTSSRSRAAAAMMAMVSMVFANAPSLHAQPELEEATTPSVGLVITDLQAVLGPGTVAADAAPPTNLKVRALVENRGAAAVTDLEVAAVVHPPVTTRSDLRQALDRDQPEGFTTLREVPVRSGGTLGPGDVVGVDIEIPGSAAGWAGTDAIYPVRIVVSRAFEVLDEVTTAVVHLETTPAETLTNRGPDERGLVAAVMVWPLSTAPWRGPDGAYAPGMDDAIALGGRLERLLAALEANPHSPVLLSVPAHLIEDLRDRADGFEQRTPDGAETVPADAEAAVRARSFLDRLQALASELPYPPIAGAYADADIAALDRGPAPLPRLGAEAATEGRARLRELIGRSPDGATYLAGETLDAEALDLVPAEHVLLPWAAVEGPDLSAEPDLPPPLRRLTTPRGRRLSAVVADPYATQLVAAPATEHGDAVAVQRVLAETAMVHLVQPSRVQPLLILPPPDWQPDPQVATTLLTALRQSAWVRLTTPTDQLAATSESGGEAALASSGSGFPGDLEGAIAGTAAELEALVASLPEDAESIGNRTSQELQDQLLRATSLWFRGPDLPRATALVADIQSELDRRFGEVTVPASAQITLTSERGALPVTLQRGEGGPLNVRVTVSSRGNLRWPERSQEVALTGPGTQTVSFDTVALGRGTFNVTVRVTDITGTRLLEQANISVRSTAISRPALIATAAVILLLLLWAAVRRRRPRPPNLEVVRDPREEVGAIPKK